MSDSHDKLVEIYRAGNLPEAYAMRNALEGKGIRAIIENESLQGALGEVPLGWSTLPKLMVAGRDQEAARALIDELVRRPGKKGDNDHGLAATEAIVEEGKKCPERGWTFAEKPEGPETDLPTTPRPASPIPELGAMSESHVWLEIAVIGSISFLPSAAWSVINHLEPASPLSDGLNLLSFAASSIGPILVTLFVISRSGLSLSSFGLRRPGPADFVAGLALMLFMLMIWGVIANVRIDSDATEEGPNWQTITFSWGLCTVLVNFMVAIAEELVYRSYLITRLSTQLRSPVLAVLISAFLYTTTRFHWDLISILHVVSMGILFGIFFCVWPRFWTYAIANGLLFTADAFRAAATG